MSTYPEINCKFCNVIYPKRGFNYYKFYGEVFDAAELIGWTYEGGHLVKDNMICPDCKNLLIRAVHIKVCNNNKDHL